jgi:hypothetical protein
MTTEMTRQIRERVRRNQSLVVPSVPAARIDGRSLTTAWMCVLALFITAFGWFFAVAG